MQSSQKIVYIILASKLLAIGLLVIAAAFGNTTKMQSQHQLFNAYYATEVKLTQHI